MNAQLREILRINILRTAEAHGAVGAGVEALWIGAKTQQIPASLPDVENEIAYLADKGLLASVPKKLSPENKLWRITAEGRDHLAEAGY